MLGLLRGLHCVIKRQKVFKEEFENICESPHEKGALQDVDVKFQVHLYLKFDVDVLQLLFSCVSSPQHLVFVSFNDYDLFVGKRRDTALSLSITYCKQFDFFVRKLLGCQIQNSDWEWIYRSGHTVW